MNSTMHDIHPLATIYHWTVDESAPVADVSTFRERFAVRAIIYDGQKVALLHVTKQQYYMLPGGGTDGEELHIALQRELAEELGCTATVERELGTIVTYVERWRNKQIDTGFICRLDQQTHERHHTEFEQAEGHELVWAPSLAATISLMEQAIPAAPDGKVIRARDLAFLHAVQDLPSV